MDKLKQMIKELRSLNEPVPNPIPLPDESQISEMEKELGIRFSSDYRVFLLKASDVVFGSIEPATITVKGSHTHLSAIVSSAREGGVPKTLLPFCEDNSDFYCLNSSGEVVFWSHNGVTNEKWDSLASWIEEVWIGENA